jgi:hypothetical protein
MLRAKAFEEARAMGVMRYEVESSSYIGGRSTHEVIASFQTAFQVNMEVSVALKKASVQPVNSSDSAKSVSITEYLGIGSYCEWPEGNRQEWLLSELNGKRSLFGPDLTKSDEIVDVLQTSHVLAAPPSASLLLQRECHVKMPLRVVLLFEKLASSHGFSPGRYELRSTLDSPTRRQRDPGINHSHSLGTSCVSRGR